MYNLYHFLRPPQGLLPVGSAQCITQNDEKLPFVLATTFILICIISMEIQCNFLLNISIGDSIDWSWLVEAELTPAELHRAKYCTQYKLLAECHIGLNTIYTAVYFYWSRRLSLKKAKAACRQSSSYSLLSVSTLCPFSDCSAVHSKAFYSSHSPIHNHILKCVKLEENRLEPSKDVLSHSYVCTTSVDGYIG